MLADVLDDGSCYKTGGFKSLGLTGSVGEVASCKAIYPGGHRHCEVVLVNENGYSYADFTFPNALNNPGDTVKVELQYSLSNFACVDDDNLWGFREYTSDQWLRASMVRSTSYYICTAFYIPSTDVTRSGGGGLTQLTPAEGECASAFISVINVTNALC